MKKISRALSGIRFGWVLALSFALFSGLMPAARAAQTASVTALPAGATDAGVLPSSTQVTATIYLQPDAVRTAALTQYLSDLQTPSSPNYKQWLSTADFTAKFGPTDAQMARVKASVHASGLSVVSTTGLRMVVSGTATQLEAAFAPALHQVALGGKMYVAAMSAVSIPAKISGDVAAVGGMTTLPETTTALKLTMDGAGVTPGSAGSLADLSTAIEANTARVLTVDGTACAGDFAETARIALGNVLREAAAQGMTTLASSGCTTSGETSFPAALPDVVAVVPPAGITGDSGSLAGTARPAWQNAPGLPSDTLRHEPDLAVSTLAALAQTLDGILAQMDTAALKLNSAAAPARLGNVAQTLYEMAPLKGLYTQPDATTTGLTGNWEAGDGLGLVDLGKLTQWFPRGTLSTYITVTTTPAYATHGSPITFSANVKDISGQGTAVPTGTVTFATSAGLGLGTGTLTPDSVGSSATVSSNIVPAGGFNVVATYSGDSEYSSNSNQTYFTVGPEEGTLSATTAGAVNLGGTIVVTISDKSTSGVGTPNVTGYVMPQGIPDTNTYKVALTGSNGVATGTVNIPASIGGSITLLVGCTSSDPSFTCYNSTDITATVNKATPTATMTVSPSQPVANQPVNFTVSFAGVSGQVAPTGTVIIFDNGVNIGSTGINPSTNKATYTANGLSATATHAFTATYYGDNNYGGISVSPNASNGTNASTTALSVSPNPPVNGSTTTLTATVTSGVSGVSTTPTGTVTFYQDSVALSPTVAVASNGVATYTSTTLSGSAAHTFYAVYSGDTTYQSSQSANVPTAASGTVTSTTTLAVSPNPPVSGSTTTLTAKVASGSSSTTTTPTGTVTFYQDGVALGTASPVNSSGVATYTSTTLSGATAHTFYASYSGDSTYAASTSTSVPTAASTAGSTTTMLNVNPNPPVGGSLTTLTATIGYTANGTAVPTGTVTFSMDGSALTPNAGVMNGTTATYTSTTLTSSSAHSFTAKYNGDTNYTTSTSPAVPTTSSTGLATTVLVSVTPNPPVAGQTTTLKATITPATSTTLVPTGTVTFYQDGAAIGSGASAPVVSGTSATYTTTALTSTAAHVYSAQYSGDANFASVASANSVSTPAASSGAVVSATTITASPTTVTAGGTTTLIATVTSGATSSTTIPTGTVTFTSSTQGLLGTAPLNAAGVATLTPILSTAGASTITATYNGDSTYAASTSATPAAVTVTGTTVSPTITLTISPTTVSYGGTVTFTTTITAAPTTGTTGPAGSVTWTVTSNATGVATSYTQALTTTSTTTASASATITAPAVGNYTVTATCTGTNFSCTGLTISKGLAVTKVVTTLSLVADPNPPVSGSPELLTAYISSASGAINATCGGNVNFYVNGVLAGASAASGNQAQLVTTLPLATGNIVYAIYIGDANCAASTSSTLTLSTPPAATTTTVTASPTTALYTANVTITAVVSSVPTATNPSPGYPTGSVTFYDTFNGTQAPIGSASLAQNGPYSSLASFQTTGLQAGTHAILAIYAGAKAYSTSTADVITVNITDFSTQFSPSSSTVTAGQTVTALATVTPINGFSGQVVLGCVPPAASNTTCTFSPNVLTTGSGIVTMTITTTKPTTGALRLKETGGVVLALTLLGVLWPGRRRKRLPFALAILLILGLIGVSGCTTVRSDGQATQSGTGGTTSSGGTPSGTLQFAVTASGTDGRTTNRHSLTYSVTVQ